MWVVKLGGSLAFDPALKDWLEVLSANGGGRVVIVPGGGPFADQVRELQAHWGFDDAAAHRMALHAMEQYGLMLVGLTQGLAVARTEKALQRVLRQAGVAVWLPTAMTVDNREIPEGWELTSDSLAAWLGRRLWAERLVLVKSCPLPSGEADPQRLAEQHIVDRFFPDLVQGACYRLLLLERGQHALMQKMLLENRQMD